MKIEYVSHACLLIDTGREKILTDPWFNGPAYNNQWHLFPKPINTEKIMKDIDYILITHGHEDHLHEASLKLLPKTAKLYYPYTWYGDATPYFKELGFFKSMEASSWKRIKLSQGTFITYISHNLDTIVIVESDGEVLVNINDALPAHNKETIDFFTSKITERWKNIDYVFSGLGGASYFPNTIHVPSKNDKEIGILREQLFVRNYFRIINNLKPKVAVPFAADFVLLDKDNLWINEVKDDKYGLIEKYYSEFPENKNHVNMVAMFSGDILNKLSLDKNSDFHEIPREQYQRLIYKEYQTEIEQKAFPKFINEERAEELVEKIKQQIVQRKQKLTYYAEKTKNIRFDILITDLEKINYYHICIKNHQVTVERTEGKNPESIIEIQIRSDDILYSFSGDWTGDVINIGYAPQIYVAKEEYVLNGLESACIKLLTNHPNENEYITKPSVRSFKFIISNPIHRDWFMKKLLRSKQKNLREQLYFDGKTYDRPIWLTKNKCEICEICKLPNIDT